MIRLCIRETGAVYDYCSYVTYDDQQPEEGYGCCLKLVSISSKNNISFCNTVHDYIQLFQVFPLTNIDILFHAISYFLIYGISELSSLNVLYLYPQMFCQMFAIQ